MTTTAHIDRRNRTDGQHIAAAARTRKAHRIADVLRSFGSTSADAAVLDAAGRTSAAELAGVRPASDTTWACVVALLQLWESGR